MSYLIGPENVRIFDNKTSENIQDIKIKQVFLAIHKNHRLLKNLTLTQRKNKKELQANVQTYNPTFRKDGILRVTLQIEKHSLTFSMILLDNKLPISIISDKLLLQVIRQTHSLNSKQLASLSNLNLVIDKGGIITLKSTVMLSSQILKNSLYFQKLYKSIVKQILQLHTHIFYSIFKISNILPGNLEHCLFPNPRQLTLQNRLQRYLSKCEMFQNIKKKIQKRSQNLKIFDNLSDSQEEDFHKTVQQFHHLPANHQLYSLSFGLNFQQKTQIFSQEQISRFENLLTEPKPRVYSKMENRFTFNYILVSNPLEIQANPYQFEDSFHYKISKLKFKYTKTTNQQFSFKNQENIINEPLIPFELKEESINEFLIKNVFIKVQNKAQDKEKLEHQVQIINKFRLTSSGYLFKYYISTQLNFRFKDHLIMDAYSGINFDALLSNNKDTFSLRIKLMYLTQLAHVFCFLKENKVSYLSLNKKKMIIRFHDIGLLKLVDFSNSYNQSICSKYGKFIPDYTIQYAAPQIFMDDVSIYNEKQDVFSLGMIAYEMLNSQILFNYSEEKIIKKYKSKQVLQNQLICPQRGQYMCYRKIYNYLNFLISKCLNSNPQLRPSPYWIVIVLKEIMSLLLKF